MHEFRPVTRLSPVFDELEQQEVEEEVILVNAGCAACGCSEFHPLHFV